MRHFKTTEIEPEPQFTCDDARPFKLNSRGICDNCGGNYFYDIGVEECPYCVAGYKVVRP
jgi:hypothetical protein